MSKIVSDLNSEFRLTFDGADEWGWVLGWFFAIAQTLYLAGEDIPANWQYRPGALVESLTLGEIAENLDGEHSWEDATVADFFESGLVDADDLRYAGNVLARYANLVKLAGKDY